MGIFDRLTGTRYPAEGVPSASRDEVRTALLALNGPGVPYVVRYSAGEQCDLVAEWRLREPAWGHTFLRSEISHAVRIRMRFDRDEDEVRALEEQWELTRVGSPPRLQVTSKYSRGPSRTVSRRGSLGRDVDGRLRVTETFRYDSAALRDASCATVLENGWTWRGVIFGRL
ncbi:hypothetical protein [Streptomyces sp. NPDC093260]|uniref:hypothetical protein n=1 Tax=Streptomyces sp. NPDC093260 TaxID=3155073 RepID=UPI00343FEA05